MRIFLGVILSLFFVQAVSSTMALPQDFPEIRRRIANLIQSEPEERLTAIEKYGVDIFVVKVKGRIQNNFKTLKWAPEKFAQIAEDFDDGSTAGLFLTPSNIAYDVVKPTILIAQDAEPWALIHEFVHALIDESRVKKAAVSESALVLQLEDAREDLNEMWWHFKEANSLGSKDEVSHMLTAFTLVAKLETRLLEAVQLEEIVVEGLLRQAYDLYKPADFKSESYNYSEIYINKSAESAQNQLHGILGKCPDLVALALREESPLMPAVVRTCISAEALKKEINRRLEVAL